MCGHKATLYDESSAVNALYNIGKTACPEILVRAGDHD
jgi:hypothetical protein